MAVYHSGCHDKQLSAMQFNVGGKLKPQLMTMSVRRALMFFSVLRVLCVGVVF